MFSSKRFIKRFIVLAVLLNLPPVITSIFIHIGLEPILLIVSLGIWSNVSLLAGLGYFFDSSNIVYGEFGVTNASAIVIFSIVVFWIICAAFLARVSLFFSNRSN